jgi:amino acid transporter
MFSKGQLVFAVVFFVSFIIVMIYSYRKDFKLHKEYYKGSIWILLAFIIFIGFLYFIKSIMKES